MYLAFVENVAHNYDWVVTEFYVCYDLIHCILMDYYILDQHDFFHYTTLPFTLFFIVSESVNNMLYGIL